MSKLRRSNICSSSRNGNKANNDIAEQSSSRKLQINKNKLLSHGEFLNRIQRSLYYGSGRSKISIPLSDYIADTFSESHRGYSLNRLNYATVGNLRSTPCTLILAMIYLERLKDADPAYSKHVTPTELFLVSMMVATKFYSGHDDDAPYVNWTECANTTADNLIQMELAFLSALDWKVFVSNDEFFEKVQSLETALARRQGMQRGWFTYVELNSLLPSIQIAKHFLQTTLILGLSYTAFVATMVASVFLVSQIPGTYLNASSKSSNSVNDITATNNLLDLIVERLNETPEMDTDNKQPVNRSQWNLMSFASWYSFLKSNTYNWPVITKLTNDEDQLKICNNSLSNGLETELFCNSTSPFNIFSIQPDAERFNFDLSGIRSTYA